MPSRTNSSLSAPYLTHMVSYHGQTTLTPPDNQGRIRKPAPSKSHSTPAITKSPQESPTRASSSSRLQNSCSCRDSVRYSIPNYPPPSFQEAMASSYAPSTSNGSDPDDSESVHRVSLAPSERTLTEEEISRLSTTATPGTPASILFDKKEMPASPDSESFSDTSSRSSLDGLDYIDVACRPESPTPASSSQRRFGSLLTSDPDDDSTELSDTVKHKSRALSLSPLRTLLPSSKGGPSSAHSTFLRASTSTSNLLARASSSPFFRSTTSLASPASESPRKKIFSGKGKQKVDDEHWEVLETPSGTEDAVIHLTKSRKTFPLPPSPRRNSVRHPTAPPATSLPPIRIPPADTSPRPESPPIVTVRTRKFPRAYVPSPLAHDDPFEAAVNIPLPSTPGVDSDEPYTPIMSSMGSPTTPRHHYPGRPLPRPPGIDGAAAHLLTRPLTPPMRRVALPPVTPPRFVPRITTTAPSSRGHTSSQSCPEGLLIDLRESTVVQTPMTPSAIEDLLDVFSDTTSEAATEPISRSRSPFSQAEMTYSEQTDLDLLASQLTDENARTGADYDAILLISEFSGPASPGRTRRNALSSNSRLSTSSVAFPTSPPGSANSTFIKTPTRSTSPPLFLQAAIELERRRVTKDGRVKLKLSLLGSSVDKCGICFTQFKTGETGAKGRGCRDGHAFHGACLSRWCAASAREPRCPICRELLGTT